MTDAMEKVAGVQMLPIFPLPLVLMPGELLPLHIYEPRYREMLRDIELKRNLFGIAFADVANTGVERPPVGSIGCAAEVRETQGLPDGRSNIVASGVVRYRLDEYIDDGTPYYLARIEFFEDEPDTTPQLESVAEEVRDLFGRTAKAALKLNGSRGPYSEITETDPEKLSFLVAGAFDLGIEHKVKLLEMTSTFRRLEALRAMLAEAAGQMEEKADVQELVKKNGHRKTDIDL